jgi:cytochrome c
MRVLLLMILAGFSVLALGQEVAGSESLVGDAERGRLVFGPCRTCHYPDEAMGHTIGPYLHRIFGKVAGKQEGFDYYSDTFKQAQFVWTPQLLNVWLADPLKMFPDTNMMSLGVPDPQQRADLIEYLKRASVRGEQP